MARMFPKVLLLLLLESVSSDRLRFHLENLVDRNVSACDDFYHHVCSQKVDPNEFFINRVATFFENVTERLRPGAVKSSPIEYDVDFIRTNEYYLEDNNYEMVAKNRCKDDLLCYMLDQQYYAKFMRQLKLKPIFTNASMKESLEDQINSYTTDTSAMIDEMVTLLNTTGNFRLINTREMYFFTGLQTRIHMIEFMKSNETFSDFHEIVNVGETLKKRMIDYIEKSRWLHGEEISNFLREKIKEKIDSIKILHDFDELDKNVTTLQKLNRDFNHLYFSNERSTGVQGLDAYFKIYDAYSTLKFTSSPEMIEFMSRIMQNFGLNAFYSESKIVTMLAPLMYRPVFQTDAFEEPIITYHVLGHELFHALFSPDSPVLLALYGHRRECVISHYNQTCTKFGMGSCMSGNQTITEDASDLESFRLIYDFVQEKYGAEKLKETIDGMETNLDQAFFYYAGSSWCDEDRKRSQEETKDEPHSNENIRINAAFSLMPEFTNAFGCQKGDAMYMKQKDSCYIFGPNS